MDIQTDLYKELISKLFNRKIVPLEIQIEAQSKMIKELTKSLESLSQHLTDNKSSRNSVKSQRNSLRKKLQINTRKIEEKKQREADLQEIRRLFLAGMDKLKSLNKLDAKIILPQIDDEQSETEYEVEKEEELQIIDIELSQLGDYENSPILEYNYSDDALIAISSLFEIEKSNLLIKKPNSKVVWVLRLFWQLQGKEFSHSSAIEQWNSFINNKAEKLDEFFFKLRTEFDFSMKNLDKVESLIKNKIKFLNPYLFDYCPAAFCLVSVICNAIEYSGVVSSASALRYRRLLYKKTQY